jgi:hypothetical protein
MKSSLAKEFWRHLRRRASEKCLKNSRSNRLADCPLYPPNTGKLADVSGSPLRTTWVPMDRSKSGAVHSKSSALIAESA